ncbi:MAG: MFS transporter [Nitrososphaerales archaeon]
MFGSKRESNAVVSLVAARIVYAINWLNVGAIFVLMGPDLGAGVGGLGSVTSSFYIGIGLAQIPGGLLAARWGPKKVVVVGIFASSFAVLATSVCSTVPEIAALRFVVGAGMALVFAPGVVMVARLFRGERSGLGVGLFNSAYDAGGLVGLLGWIVIATATGWRPSLALGGGLGILTGVLVLLYVPRDEARADFAVRSDVLANILRDKQLILLGLGTLGLAVGNVVIATFMGYYLVHSYGLSPSTAEAMASTVVALPIFTALIGGRYYDRTTRPKLMIVASLAVSSGALLVGAFPSPIAALACAVAGGVAAGFGYTAAFAGARDLNRAEREYDGLAVAWVNCISLSGSFWPPLLYSYLAESSGYPSAWLGSAAVSALLVVPLLFMKEGFGREATAG